MAVIYSYPHATPDLGDMVLGTKFENGVISTNSFYISDIVNLVTSGGPQGPVGPAGPTGSAGAQGIVGPTGPQGTQGAAGGTGSAGIQGIQGSIGPSGPIGPVGPAGLNWQGAWASGTSYIADDAVGYNGASWFCILATSGTTSPDLDATHWALLASQGAQGIQGIQGSQGSVGATGSQGVQGIQGIQGPIGLTGQAGPQGATGAQGPIGGGGTLQQTVNLGNTITDGYNTMTVTAESIKTNNFLGGQIEVVGGISTAKPYIKFGLPNSGGKTVTLTHADTQVSSRIIKLPDNNGIIALTTDIIPQTLQQVTTAGNTTTDSILISGSGQLSVSSGPSNYSVVSAADVFTTNSIAGSFAFIHSSGYIGLGNSANYQTSISLNNLTNNGVQFELPNKTTGTYTLATTTDIVPQTLQQVTTANNTTTNSIIVEDNTILVKDNYNDTYFEINGYELIGKDLTTNESYFQLGYDGQMYAFNPPTVSYIQSLAFNTSGTSLQDYVFPSKPAGTYTLATTSDIPTPAYLKYVCNLNQSGIANPTVTVLENTLGNIVWTRTGIGVYLGTLSGAFPVISKVWFSKPNSQGLTMKYNVCLNYSTANTITLNVFFDDNVTPIDDIDLASIEIRVYP